MTLVRYEPFSLLDRFQKELNRLGSWEQGAIDGGNDDASNVVTSAWRPAVDIKEEANQFVILADVPGVDPKDIEITAENGVLTVRGERKAESSEEREGFRRVERIRGTFYRRFSLPDTADTDAIKARGKDGVLEITVPKHEKVQPRKITVQN